MNQLLMFLVFLIAIVIYTIALEKLLNNPLLVSAIIFVTFLIVSVITMDYIYLIFTFVYAIVSYLTAYIICLIKRFSHRDNPNCNEPTITSGMSEIESNSQNLYCDANYLCSNNKFNCRKKY